MKYFNSLHEKTATRYWVNNPTLKECKEAIENGAFACTTNPAYCAKLFQTDPAYVKSVVKKVVEAKGDPSLAAEKVYHAIAKDLMELFLPVYEESKGTKGFVTIQEDPRHEEDVAYILEASLRAKELGPNFMAKIPVTKQGLKVIAAMVEHNIPICATEIFGVSQVMELLRVYEESAKKSNNRPIMYITHITGIMDQYFQDLVKKEQIELSKQALELAGTTIGLKIYRLLQDRGLQGTLLGGGARGLHHFTNFVGGDMHITINWSTALELNEKYSEAVSMIDREIPQEIVEELLLNLPNFKRAYDDEGMKVDEFADYGPVMLFRTQFMNGYSRLVDATHLPH